MCAMQIHTLYFPDMIEQPTKVIPFWPTMMRETALRDVSPFPMAGTPQARLSRRNESRAATRRGRSSNRRASASLRLLAVLMHGASQADVGWLTQIDALRRSIFVYNLVSRSLTTSHKSAISWPNTYLLGRHHTKHIFTPRRASSVSRIQDDTAHFMHEISSLFNFTKSSDNSVEARTCRVVRKNITHRACPQTTFRSFGSLSDLWAELAPRSSRRRTAVSPSRTPKT